MNTNRKNQQKITDSTHQQAQGQNTGPGDMPSEARGAKAAESWDQIAAKLSGVADRPAGPAPEQSPAREEAGKGQPDASDVDRMTAAVRQAWGLGEAEATEPTERPTASAAPPRPDITHITGLQPRGGSGPGAWEHFSGGVRDALGDFVSRVFHGQSAPEPADKAREPEIDRDPGLDR